MRVSDFYGFLGHLLFDYGYFLNKAKVCTYGVHGVIRASGSSVLCVKTLDTTFYNIITKFNIFKEKPLSKVNLGYQEDVPLETGTPPPCLTQELTVHRSLLTS